VPNDQIPAVVTAAAEASSAIPASSTPLTDDLDNTSLYSTLLSVSDVTILPEEFFHGLVSAVVVVSRPHMAVVTATVYPREEQGRYIITNYVYDLGPATPTA